MNYFLLLNTDILNYLLVFLSWRDLYRLALSCRRLSEIVRRYFSSISVDFTFNSAPGFEIASDGKVCRRVKPGLTNSSDSSANSGATSTSNSGMLTINFQIFSFRVLNV